jgi:UDP-N-acetylglucosamine 2-epimerase (non-hydrolysing)
VVPAIAFTGQHAALRAADYGLDQYPAFRLDCPGQDDPHAYAGIVTNALTPLLAAEAPDLVIVQGDTSSALAGALAARIAAIPLAHVEAGLRSHDLRRPWPEEEFRIAIDRDSDLLFAPTELSAANLRRERVRGEIHVTGNSGIDAVIALRRNVRGEPRGDGRKLLVTCHRRENWGIGLHGVAGALGRIADDGLARIDMLLHPNPVLSATIRRLLAGHTGISFLQPLNHLDTPEAMLACDLVLSDSGGMQEEAAALGVPLLVLRDRTERPEGIATGNMELVGTDPSRIVPAVRRRLGTPKASIALPFGDGRAGERIASVIADGLSARDRAEPPNHFRERGSRANASG